jgi:hypothetical protein
MLFQHHVPPGTSIFAHNSYETYYSIGAVPSAKADSESLPPTAFPALPRWAECWFSITFHLEHRSSANSCETFYSVGAVPSAKADSESPPRRRYSQRFRAGLNAVFSITFHVEHRSSRPTLCRTYRNVRTMPSAKADSESLPAQPFSQRFRAGLNAVSASRWNRIVSDLTSQHLSCDRPVIRNDNLAGPQRHLAATRR